MSIVNLSFMLMVSTLVMSRLAGQAVHHAQIAGTETKKLKGQIFDLERKAGLRPLIRPSSGVSHRMGDSLDVLGHIPWHPAGRGRSTTPLCKASPEMTNVSLMHQCHHMFILGTGWQYMPKVVGLLKISHDMNAMDLH